MIASTVAGCNKKKICDKFELILNTAGGNVTTQTAINKYLVVYTVRAPHFHSAIDWQFQFGN